MADGVYFEAACMVAVPERQEWPQSRVASPAFMRSAAMGPCQRVQAPAQARASVPACECWFLIKAGFTGA
jgi:hypothetical protein